MTANSYLQIDLQTLKDNVHQLQRELGSNTELIPVLKGNAYGLGAARLACVLGKVDGIRTFAVSHVSEGIELREAGISEQILVMSLPLDFQVQDGVNYGLVMTLGSFRQFPIFRDTAQRMGRRIPISLKVDTGLHRIGFLPEETEQLIAALKENEDYLEIRGTFSHFSEHTSEQMALQAGRFRDFIHSLRSSGIDPGKCHIASSASIETGADVLFDAVRIGRGLILDSPEHPTGRIREAVSFRAYLTDVRERKAGDTLGYDRKAVLEHDTKVGVLSIGYGDGLDPALAAEKAPVLVNGERAHMLTCCMDQSFVDLGDITASAGDEVTLFGYDRMGTFLSAQTVTSLIDCEGCDLTVRLTDRVQRIYSC